MSDVVIIPSIMLRRGQKWNGGYKLIVRLGCPGEQKGKKLPAVFLYRYVIGSRIPDPDATALSWLA